MSCLFVIIINQFGDNFRIGLGVKAVAAAKQLFLQFLIVLYDPVVDCHYHPVVAEMGMGVNLAWLPVGGPTGMADAAAAGHGSAVVCFFRQDLQPSLGLYNINLLGVVI